jgi:hypothetical protein
MTDTKRARLVRKKKVQTFGGRGQIYSWLRTHHAAIEPLRAVHLNLWAALAADMVEDGVTEASEGRGLRDRIWKSWQRVCRDVAAEVAAAKPKKVPPSRIPPEWRPTVVPPRPGMPTSTQVVVKTDVVGVPVQHDPRIDPSLSPHAQAELERLFRDFDELENKRIKLY